MNVFLREFGCTTDFEGNTLLFEFEVCDPAAYVAHVSLRKEYFDDLRLKREWMCVTVRDRGVVTEATMKKGVIVLRRLNDIVGLDEQCGKLIGYLQSSVWKFQFYVFEAALASRSIDSTPEETTLSPPATASSTLESRKDPASCPCVFDGPTAHSPEAEIAAQTDVAAEPQDDWGFLDESPGSGA